MAERPIALPPVIYTVKRETRMKTAADYRARAKECADWALKAKTEQERAGWQELADAWTQLAENGVILPDGFVPPNLPEPSQRH